MRISFNVYVDFTSEVPHKSDSIRLTELMCMLT